MVDAIGGASLPAAMLEGANLVLIDEPPNKWPGVASDAFGAGRVAAEHLLSLGHERFGFLGPATNVHAIRMRERGFVRTIGGRGFAVSSTALRRVPATAAGGQVGMRALLALESRPTAVFCTNDLVAAGALKVCSVDSVRVPQDMSIVGCDDIELASLLLPELTTVAIPARELGARAARLLLNHMRSDEAEPRPDTRPQRMVASRLVIRGSTAVPPKPKSPKSPS